MSEREVSLTPMMQQYMELRKTVAEDTLLLFRLGDFYELFNKDAEIGSKVLGIVLTHRQSVPMAGIPHHAADVYIVKLIQAGYKVAICDQMEEARPGKIVRRNISKILTPGTVISENLLQSNHNQYTVCIKLNKSNVSFAWIEVSTGEFQIADVADIDELFHIVSALMPQEIVIDAADIEKWEQLPTRDLEVKNVIFKNSLVSQVPHYYFDATRSISLLKNLLHVENFHGYGIEQDDLALIPAGALIMYITDNLKQQPSNVLKIKKFQQQYRMVIDAHTFRHLELVRNASGTRKNTLLETIDYTQTSIGARCLERFLMEPCIDKGEIVRRHRVVDEFYKQFEKTKSLSLKNIGDVPRVLTRLYNGSRNPRELGVIRTFLNELPEILLGLKSFNSKILDQLIEQIQLFPELCELLKQALVEELPADISEGNFIRQGYDTEIDRLKNLVQHSHDWLSQFELQEQQRTGIKNLKVKYNNSFGYFIEVTKSNLKLVPEDYIRRQTTVNSERYITPALREKEREILSAHSVLLEKEIALYRGIVEKVLSCSKALYEMSNILAEIDVFRGWAELSQRMHYVCPEMIDTNEVDIKEGRHPVVERIIHESSVELAGMRNFIPNDTYLNAEKDQIALITGPNMAGKSTYIRQVALIHILAQIGCWVPAKKCRIGVVDRIFSRIGANDDLASGTSTFMVEMNETANILNNATNRSLVILDEVGRGTSTYDGLSIAWAVVEFLHGTFDSGPRTLFATHYHELTNLAKKLPRVKNFHVAVKEWNEEIIFLRKIEPGAADRSYGIQVACLAGMPKSVIERAKEILEKLESEGNFLQNILFSRKRNIVKENQLDLFL